MNNNIVIALDNGKMNLKIKLAEKELIYRNKYSDSLTDDLLGADTFNVRYKNKKFTIGANAETSDRNEGKGSTPHLVQALTAITRVISPKEQRPITLVYGESVDKYFNAEHKATIKMALEGKHSIVVNEEEYVFEIEQVQILPEGIGHILQDIREYSGIQYVVDIGGGTINFLTVNNGRPEPKRSRSLPLGVNNVVDKIILKLKREADIEVKESDLILQWIKNRKSCKSIKALAIIDETIAKHFAELDVQLGGFVDLHKLLEIQPVTFIGGGSELFEYQINKYYKSEVAETLVLPEAVKSNVRGFYTFGMAKFSK